MRNPIVRATRLAYAALTTKEAIQWYRETAIQTYLVAVTLVTLAYCLVEDWLLDPQELPADVPPLDAPEMPCLPYVAIAGLLPPAKPVTRVTAPILPSSGLVIVPPVADQPEAPKPVKRTRKPKTLVTVAV